VLADAALFCAVHDILRSQAAVTNVVRHLVEGGWVASGGGKWAPPWMVGLNLLVHQLHRPYVDSFDGFDRPWTQLERCIDELRVLDVAWGSAYLAVGRTAATPPPAPPS